MGPPPTSHFHLMADTPTGVQPLPFKGMQVRCTIYIHWLYNILSSQLKTPSQQLLSMSTGETATAGKEASSSADVDVSNLG